MRKAGIGAIKSKNKTAALYREKVNEITENDFLTQQRQFATVKLALEEFAHKHAKKIKSNQEFRKHFQTMCANVGVDPISSSKGNWSSMLSLGDYYYKMSIKIIEICLASQKSNGGLTDIEQVCEILNETKNRFECDVSTDDIERAVKQLSCFGNGFCIVRLPNSSRVFIQSLPMELSYEVSFILGLAENTNGCITIEMCRKKTNWPEEQVMRVLDRLVTEGICWVDLCNGQKQFWIPSLFRLDDE